VLHSVIKTFTNQKYYIQFSKNKVFISQQSKTSRRLQLGSKILDKAGDFWRWQTH
jgi:hypothetical protein